MLKKQSGKIQIITYELTRFHQTKKYMPFDNAVIIGSEFWNIIARETAYKELFRDIPGSWKRKK